MVATHHYYISIENTLGKPENLDKTFFELESKYAGQFLQSVKSIKDDKDYIKKNADLRTRNKMKKVWKRLKRCATT